MFTIRGPRRRVLTLMLTAGLTLSSAAFATQVTVSAFDNPDSAGHAFAPGGGNIVSPAAAVAGGDIVTFSYVSGQWNCTPGPTSGPDGFICFTSSMTVNASNGISSFDFEGANNLLAGVFVGATEPADPAPAGLTFWRGTDPNIPGSIQDNFTDLFPVLNQMFFIGDGLTGQGTGATQQFHAPAGAVALYLGFPDAGSYHGDPGAYGDNSGAVVMDVEVNALAATPEPASMGLLALGLAGIGMAARRLRGR